VVFKKKLKVVTILVILAISFLKGSLAAELDHSLIGLALDKFSELDSFVGDEALDLLRGYVKTQGNLDELKTDLPSYLGGILGEDYEAKLNSKGISLGQMRSEIDKMKQWSVEDRLKVVDLIEAQNSTAIANIIDKYSGLEDVSNFGGGNSGGSSEATQGSNINLPKIDETTVGFRDIKNHWAAAYIEFAQTKGIIQGKSEGVFAPEDKVTRAEFTAMLTRLLGLGDNVNQEMVFIDVARGDWFFEAVNQAFAKGIIQGKGDRFDPNSFITREEMIVIMIRSATLKGKPTLVGNIEITELLASFSDRDLVSSWAKTEIAVALKLGLVKGQAGNILAPRANATRAEAATMVFNLYKLLVD